MKKEAGFPNS